MSDYDGSNPQYMTTEQIRDRIDLARRAKAQLGEDYSDVVINLEAELRRRELNEVEH